MSLTNVYCIDMHLYSAFSSLLTAQNALQHFSQWPIHTIIVEAAMQTVHQVQFGV